MTNKCCLKSENKAQSCRRRCYAAWAANITSTWNKVSCGAARATGRNTGVQKQDKNTGVSARLKANQAWPALSSIQLSNIRSLDNKTNPASVIYRTAAYFHREAILSGRSCEARSSNCRNYLTLLTMGRVSDSKVLSTERIHHSASAHWQCDRLHQQMHRGRYGLEKCHHKSQWKTLVHCKGPRPT